MRESQHRFWGHFFGPYKAPEPLPSYGHILIDVRLDIKVMDASSLKIFEQFEFISKFHDLGTVCARASGGFLVIFLGLKRPKSSYPVRDTSKLMCLDMEVWNSFP